MVLNFEEKLKDIGNDYLNQGKLALKCNDYKNALNFFEKVKEIFPDDIETKKYITQVYLSLKKYNKIEKHILDELEETDIKEEMFFSLTYSYFYLKKYNLVIKKIIKKLNNSQQDTKQLPFLYYNLGLAYFSLNIFSKAKHFFEFLIKKYPDFSGGYIGLANFFRIKQDYVSGLNILYAYLDKNFAATEIIENIAYLNFEKGDYFESLKYLTKIINNKTNVNYFNFYIYARILEKLNLNKQSIEAYKKSINLNNEFVLSYINLSWLFLKLSDYNNAVDYMKKAIEKEKTNGWNYLKLGFIYFKKSDLKQAINNFEIALKKSRDDKNLKEIIKKIYSVILFLHK